jgi:hypothetical protein
LWPPSLCQRIVNETEIYTSQRQLPLLQLTLQEMRAFLGICMIMSCVQSRHIEDHWASGIGTPLISATMPRHRFLSIFHNLHFNDNAHASPRSSPHFDELYKVRPILDELETTFRDAFEPGEFITLDEGMIGFKGRTPLKFFVPRKPTPNGLKVNMASDAETGYVLKFMIDTKSSANFVGSDAVERYQDKVALELLSRYLDCGRTVTVDRAFTSVSLADALWMKDTNLIGTLASNRKSFPASLKAIPKMNRGDYVWRSRRKSSMMLSIWQDKAPVQLLSTGYSLEPATVQRCVGAETKSFPCPSQVIVYNATKSGVDRADAMIGAYLWPHRSNKWTIPTFFWLLSLALTNGYILWQKSNPSTFRTHYDFVYAVAKSLIRPFTAYSQLIGIPYVARDLHDFFDLPVAPAIAHPRHWPRRTENRRQCVRCGARTFHICPHPRCDVPLCADDCGADFHNIQDHQALIHP